MRGAFLAISLLAFATPWQTGQDKNQSASNDNKSAQTTSSTAINPSVMPQSSATYAQDVTNREQNTRKQESKPWLTHGEWVMAILTAIYVGITGFYAWTSHLTLKAIRIQGESSTQQFEKQLTEMQTARDKTIEQMANQVAALVDAATAAHRSADAMREAAEAGKNSADALINSERPWIVPRIRKKVRWIDSLSTEEPAKIRFVYFTFSITNHGRTPAEIIAIRGRPHLTNQGINGGLEDPPDYGLDLVFMQVRILAPGQRWDYYDVDLDFRGWTDDQMKKDLEAFKLHVIFKGVVLYRDVFRPEEVHESRFCYTYFWQREAYLPSGPPEHTKYT